MFLYIFIFNILSADITEIEKELSTEISTNNKLKIISENKTDLLKSNLNKVEDIILKIDSTINQNYNDLDINYLFDTYYTLSLIYKNKSEYELAIEYNYRAFQFAEKSNVAQYLAQTYMNFGELYILLKDYKQATEYNLLGIKFCEARKDTKIKYNFLFMLGQVYYYIENYKDSEKYLLSALNETLGKDDFNTIAKIKLFLGRVYLANKDIEKAEYNLLSVEVLVNKINNPKLLAEIYRELIIVYSYKDNIDKALTYTNLALKQIKNIDNIELISDIKLNAAKLYISLKKYNEAKIYLDELEFNIDNNNNINQKLEYYFIKMNIFEMMGDYKSAYEIQKKYLMIKDDMITETKASAINDALKKYETEKKDRENQLLKQNYEAERKIGLYFGIIIVTIAVLVTLLALFLFFRNKKERKTNKLLKSKNIKIEEQKEKLESLNRELVDRNVEIEEINKNLFESESELRELNATKDKFLSIIAHDLKNPIAGIMLTSELLVNYLDKFDKKKLESKLNEINRTSVRLKELLETLLEWSRASTGQIPINPQAINIDDMVIHISQLFTSNLENKNIDLSIENPACCRVVGDEKMLETILRNIISNAIKFTPEGGRIIVSTEDLEDKLKVKIKDSGVGIPKDKIAQLFSISSNYSTLGTQKEKGTGLGLVLCKEFIDSNNGEITVDSELGKGTTFSLTFQKFTN